VAPNVTITPDVALGPDVKLPMPKAFERLDAPPVFITGQGRSGTSWTLDLFDRQPEVCAIFETWLLTQTRGLTAVLSQPHWHPEYYAQQLEAIGLPHATVQLVDYETAVRELGEFIASWLMRPVKPEHRFLVEKGPMDLAATAAMFPEARFVHVIRDGRDVSLSIEAGADSWAPAMRGGDLTARALEWRQTVKDIRHQGELLGERYYEIRFEDLRSEFDPTVRGLFEFAGTPADHQAIARAREQTDLSGYSEEARKSGFRSKGSVGGWRGRFTRADAKEFERAAGSLLIELGYEADGSWVREVPRRRGERA
jgi:hypothetical protein